MYKTRDLLLLQGEDPLVGQEEDLRRVQDKGGGGGGGEEEEEDEDEAEAEAEAEAAAEEEDPSSCTRSGLLLL